MFLGIAGAIPNDLFSDLSNVIKDLELNFNQAIEWIRREVKTYLDNVDFIEGVGYWRIRMILIAIEDNIPKMATLEYDSRYTTEMSCDIKIVEGTSYFVSFIGNTALTKEYQIKLNKQFKYVKHIEDAKDLIETFMRHTASVYPGKVNNSFEFQYAEGEIN